MGWCSQNNQAAQLPRHLSHWARQHPPCHGKPGPTVSYLPPQPALSQLLGDAHPLGPPSDIDGGEGLRQGALPTQEAETKLLRRDKSKGLRNPGSGERGHAHPKSNLSSAPGWDNCIPKSDSLQAPAPSTSNAEALLLNSPLRMFLNRDRQS